MTTAMDAVATATAGVARLYPLGKVPESPDYPYGSYTALLGRGDVLSLTGVEGIRWGRIVIQTFGHTADAAIGHYEAARAALAGTYLTITGYNTTPVTQQFDTPAVVRDPDDRSVIGVTQTFTFTATLA